MTKIRENITEIELGKIRQIWVPEAHKWYFSVVDVIALTIDTSNPRNYWKVLKNRLNKRQNKLVTECNQLKMKSKDGKSYLTDTLDSIKMLELIAELSPQNSLLFSQYFEELERLEKESYPHIIAKIIKADKHLTKIIKIG